MKRRCAGPTTTDVPHVRGAVSRENCATKGRSRPRTEARSNGNLHRREANEGGPEEGAESRAGFADAGTARRARRIGGIGHGQADAGQMPRGTTRARGRLSVWMSDGRGAFSRGGREQG